MDQMGMLGFVFGATGLSFAIIAWSQVAGLKKEVEILKKNLEGSGVLKGQSESQRK